MGYRKRRPRRHVARPLFRSLFPIKPCCLSEQTGSRRNRKPLPPGENEDLLARVTDEEASSPALVNPPANRTGPAIGKNCLKLKLSNKLNSPHHRELLMRHLGSLLQLHHGREWRPRQRAGCLRLRVVCAKLVKVRKGRKPARVAAKSPSLQLNREQRPKNRVLAPFSLSIINI